jgi:hypothetical protein
VPNYSALLVGQSSVFHLDLARPISNFSGIPSHLDDPPLMNIYSGFRENQLQLMASLAPDFSGVLDSMNTPAGPACDPALPHDGLRIIILYLRFVLLDVERSATLCGARRINFLVAPIAIVHCPLNPRNALRDIHSWVSTWENVLRAYLIVLQSLSTI